MKLLSLARDLKRRKARERHGLFVAEGLRTAEALLNSQLTVHGALIMRDADHDMRLAALCDRLSMRDIAMEVVSEREFADAADTETPQGVLLMARIPRIAPKSLPSRAVVVVLDAVQDPGNVGTIVRTSHALGASMMIALPGTVDLWNAKVVRSAMGALFSHAVVSMSWEEATSWLHAHDVALWAAAADGVPLSQAMQARHARVALVVANEGNGVSDAVAAAAAQRVAIPMTAGAESLNVAVATGILLYALGAESF